MIAIKTIEVGVDTFSLTLYVARVSNRTDNVVAKVGPEQERENGE